MNRLYLEKTITLAEEAYKLGNYPIGCVIVNDRGETLAEGSNTSFTTKDPTSHAEINAIRKLSSIDYPNEILTIYSSLELCIGCSFFLSYTNIKKVVWALSDSYKGGFSSLTKLDQTKEDFKKIKVVKEPFEDLKNLSKGLMYEFLSSKGKKSAKLFKD